MENIAVLGAGKMGTAITVRLLETGHRVTVWNRTQARTATLAKAGASVAATPAQAVAGADLVIVMLRDAAAVEAVLAEAATALPPSTPVVQMSTISPDEVRRIAARLPAEVSLVDAPVVGSVGAVRAGKLTILAGGSDSTLDLIEPVLQPLGTIQRCGRIGAAAALKLVVNTALVTALGALHDTLSVAKALDVDQATTLDVLSAGPLAAAIRRATATDASFAVSLAAKDAHLALRATHATPVLAAALHQLETAPDQDADVASLINLEDK